MDKKPKKQKLSRKAFSAIFGIILAVVIALLIVGCYFQFAEINTTATQIFSVIEVIAVVFVLIIFCITARVRGQRRNDNDAKPQNMISDLYDVYSDNGTKEDPQQGNDSRDP